MRRNGKEGEGTISSAVAAEKGDCQTERGSASHNAADNSSQGRIA